jgi:hypothetical protein
MIWKPVFAIALVAALGCSISRSSQSISDSSHSLSKSSTNFSKSSNSISDSLSNSSDSSSGSSGGGSDEAYRDDVRDYTYAYILSGGRFEAFQKGLGDLAQRHGITNWETHRASYRGLGEGLGRAKVTQTQLDVFKTNLAGSSPEKMRDMQVGYDSVI